MDWRGLRYLDWQTLALAGGLWLAVALLCTALSVAILAGGGR
jgi:hypothetical protein